jgi:Tfp pilus assembly major pilin PilA
MASRSYNPSPFPISNSIEDTLEHYNMRKNPNSQPMIFKRPPVVVIRDTPVQNVERLYGGNMKMLQMDAKEPMRRPAGFVEPHSSGAKKYVSNGNSASYPVYNSIEQKTLDGGNMASLIASAKQGVSKVINDPAVRSSIQNLAKDPRVQEFALKNSGAINKYLTPTGGKIYHPKDANLVMVGNGLWQDMNAWGKQNENNAKALFNSPQFQGVINDKRVQDLALKGLNKLVDGKKEGGVIKRGRGRPRKGTMEGEGVWEDMNAWGKRNEMAVRGVLDNPQVKAIINNPEVQKLGKKAVKTAVSMIPVIGGPASTALGMMGWGGVPRKEIVKRVMAEKGIGLIEASKYVKANNLYQPKPKGKK